MNKKMVFAAAAAGLAVAGCCCLCGTDDYPETIGEGFVSLFNGKDLSGWYGSKKYDVEIVEVRLNNGKVVKQPVIACFPDRKVVMIDSLALNLAGGGVHCWTKNVYCPRS